MISLEHDKNDLFVLSQKVLACLLKEMKEIPKSVRFAHQRLRLMVKILMFVEPSYYFNGLNRKVEKHLREIISDDRRLSILGGVDIKVTVQKKSVLLVSTELSELVVETNKKRLAKPNLIGLVFQFSTSSPNLL